MSATAGPGRPGPAGDPDRADRRAVVRPDVPAGRDRRSRRASGLPVGLRGRRLRAAAQRAARICAASTRAVGAASGPAASARPRSSPAATGLPGTCGSRSSRAGSARTGRSRTSSCCCVARTRCRWFATSRPSARPPTSTHGGQPEPAARLRDAVWSRSVRAWRTRRWGCARATSARYDRDGRPGGAALPARWWHRYEQIGRPVPVDYADEQAFRRWCATTPGAAGPRPDQSARAAAAGGRGDQVGTVRPHPAAPGRTLGPGLAPVAGDHLPRPGARLAGRLGARSAAARSYAAAIVQEIHARAAAGLLHARRHPRRRLHRDRPLRACGSRTAAATST